MSVSGWDLQHDCCEPVVLCDSERTARLARHTLAFSDQGVRSLNPPDLRELQRRLAQARAECRCWACTDQPERLQESRFVVAMLTLRIRHRQGAGVVTDREGAPTAARRCRKLDLDEHACVHDAAAPAA